MTAATRCEIGRTQRTLAYARRAYQVARVMRRHAAEQRREGLANGMSALRALFDEMVRLPFSGSSSHECNLCGWTGPRFAPEYLYDRFEEGARCWRCGSAARCRLFKLYIDQRQSELFTSTPSRVLEVGPVTYSRSFFPADVEYASLDLHGALSGVRGDLSRAPFPDGVFDFWMCSHVLDVIPDDTAAMRELLRVLSPNGVGLLDNATHWLKPTIEFAEPQLGDFRRLRRYGGDLVNRLRQVGFDVETVDPRAVFPAECRETYGLRDSPFLLCRRSRR